MANSTERPSNYLSLRSADVVLSEIRPTKLSPEALRSVNVLLDELVWMILSSSRSFSTDQLKAGLNKVLPTPLGKEALLEAEVELRAYWDRISPHTPPRPYVENTQEFPLYAAYELLRLKCESYSSFNDADEDTEAEGRWQTRVSSSNGWAPHNSQFIAPAALYLTAVIEHVCEHILSNTGRVAARDSSRTNATLQDLYIALCEDDTIYGLFKTMKVHDQIEVQSKALVNRPRRSKSIQRGNSEHTRVPSRNVVSPYGSISAGSNEASRTPSSKTRLSSESAASGTMNTNMPPSGSRSSMEKSKAKKLMFGRPSADKESSQNGNSFENTAHKRTDSLISTGRRSAMTFDDGLGSSSNPNEVEFDELMRSGATMKVSLTPDRLKTFEVYNKEKGLRSHRFPLPPSTSPIKAVSQVHDSSTDNSAYNSASDDPAITNEKKSPSTMQPWGVDSIVEDEDNVGYGGDRNGVRVRTKSRGHPPVAFDTQPVISSSRTRSMSASQSTISSITGRHPVTRKGSLSAIEPTPAPVPNKSIPMRNPSISTSAVSTNGRNFPLSPSGRDSIDDILDGSSDEGVPTRKGAVKSKGASGVSSQTRDLISFLNEGPPDLPKTMSPSMPPVDHRAKQGRFRSMVSRLRKGSSTERLTTQFSTEDLNRSRIGNSVPPPSYVPPPLSAKKSLRSISTYSHNQGSPMPSPVTQIVPPKLSVPYNAPISPPSSPIQTAGDSINASPLRPKQSPITVRKAVPTFTQSSPVETNKSPLSAHKQVDAPLPSHAKLDKEIYNTQINSKQGSDDSLPGKASMVSTTAATPVRPPSTETPAVSTPIRTQRSSASSRHTTRHALTPPSTPPLFATNAKDMRRLMANATTADECRLLVDMFLAQSGFPVKSSDFLPDPSLEPTEQHQCAVVETLLSNGDVSTDKLDSTERVSESTSDMGSGLPTPRSDGHSPVNTVFRKQPQAFYPEINMASVANAIVSAEA